MNRAHPLTTFAALLLSATFSSAPAAAAPTFSQEPATLRAGQKVRVDDGTCPTGQVKEVMGRAVRQTNGSIVIKRIYSCVRR